jgi:hypothetical protein
MAILVTDEMVEAALTAFWGEDAESVQGDMRRAIEAALKMAWENPVPEVGQRALIEVAIYGCLIAIFDGKDWLANVNGRVSAYSGDRRWKPLPPAPEAKP